MYIIIREADLVIKTEYEWRNRRPQAPIAIFIPPTDKALGFGVVQFFGHPDSDFLDDRERLPAKSI